MLNQKFVPASPVLNNNAAKNLNRVARPDISDPILNASGNTVFAITTDMAPPANS